MSTVFTLVFFICLSDKCGFATTEQQIYSTEKKCTADLTKSMVEFFTNFPNDYMQGTCIKLKIGEI